jgi:transcriptional regulator with XRE-family HTH domain
MPGFTYKSYSFVDKDPLIDYIRTIIYGSSIPLARVALDSGVSQETIVAWLYGATKRPQAATLNAVLRSLNYKLDISVLSSPMMITPTAVDPKEIIPAVAKTPKPRRLGAKKYANVHHIAAHRKKK